MADQNKDDIQGAYRSISSPDGKSESARHGKVFAGQRYEFAENPVGDEGGEKSETEKVADKASHNSERE